MLWFKFLLNKKKIKDKNVYVFQQTCLLNFYFTQYIIIMAKTIHQLNLQKI